MTRFLKKLTAFFAILLAIKAPFAFFYRDEPAARLKEMANGDFNAVFVGSSRTRDGIIPAYFDSQTNGRTKSYNFSLPAGLPPDTFDWSEEIVRTQPSVKYIFFEL